MPFSLHAWKHRLIAPAAGLLAFVVVMWAAPFTRRELSGGAYRWSADRDPQGASGALERLKEQWSRNHQLLESAESEQARLRAVVIERRKLHQAGVIAKADVLDAEQAFVALLRQIHETRRTLTETELALAEATMGDELERLPPLAVDELAETERLARFNGGSTWSLAETPKIEKYFSQTFGYQLPISAYGQTKTHNRLGFDHRDSIDVALHPDSPEGQALIRYLRDVRIPFIAFKHAVPGSATGPHIHIGRPSVRIAAR